MLICKLINPTKKELLVVILRLLVIILLGLTFSMASHGQEAIRRIKGTVKTSAGKPVGWAFIFIDRQIYEQTTRPNGKFSIKVPVNADTIAIYTIDGRFVSEPLTNRNTINILMDASLTENDNYVSKELQEIFDLGYYRSEANRMTTDVGLVESQNRDKGTYQNIYEMIKGEVPGVWVTRGNREIIIRGTGSFYLGTAPLIVVDGVPTSSIAHIDPSHVESITVLKGAATTAYGARGSNGVLVINMKKEVKK
ncbi:MAG: TonB-dependent receptor plug domain-containing protein [Bacteroidales bacterium]|nr:TonB-dependent receptor plug domain-containing protein [Bacteroidales bacterium]